MSPSPPTPAARSALAVRPQETARLRKFSVVSVCCPLNDLLLQGHQPNARLSREGKKGEEVDGNGPSQKENQIPSSISRSPNFGNLWVNVDQSMGYKKFAQGLKKEERKWHAPRSVQPGSSIYVPRAKDGDVNSREGWAPNPWVDTNNLNHG